VKFANIKARLDYNLALLSDACDWAEKNYHKKPLKSHPDKAVKIMANLLENLKNGKIGNSTRKWDESYEKYVKSRGYDWFSAERKRS